MTKPCSRCGEVKPLTEFHKSADGKYGVHAKCKVCRNADAAAYRQANPDVERARKTAWEKANPDKVAGYRVAWKQANPDKVAACAAAWYQANREKADARVAKYRKANPHITWEHTYRQRCGKFGLTPFIVSFTREDVVAQYGDGCLYCGTGPFEELDHHGPIAAGGLHILANARPSCTVCNAHKSNADREDVKAIRSGGPS